MLNTSVNVKTLLLEIENHLERGVIPFWRERAVDPEYGGFRTNFDSSGGPLPCPEKYLFFAGHSFTTPCFA